MWLYGFFFGPRLRWLDDYRDRPWQARAVLTAGALYFILCCFLLTLAANGLKYLAWGT
jgi:hypothetical protein